RLQRAAQPGQSKRLRVQATQRLGAAELHPMDRDPVGNGDGLVRPHQQMELVGNTDALPPREKLLRNDAEAVLAADGETVYDDSHPLLARMARGRPVIHHAPPRTAATI